MDERTKRNALIVGAIVLALLSIGAGALIALTSNDDRAQTTSPGPSSTPSRTLEPSGSSGSSASQTPSGSESPILEDGHHFVYVKTTTRSENGKTKVRFDLAYFLTGAKAEAAAAQHGDEVIDGYYIVNDNPRLRTLPFADDVEVEYIPESNCCELRPGNIDAWVEAVSATNPTDYAGTNVPWWFTVEGGRITRVEQQYLP